MNTLQPSQTVSEYVDLLLGNWVKSLHVPPGAFLLPAFLVHLVHFGYIFWYIWYIFWYLGTGSKASMYPSLWCIFATCQWSIKGFITRSIQPHLLYYILAFTSTNLFEPCSQRSAIQFGFFPPCLLSVAFIILWMNFPLTLILRNECETLSCLFIQRCFFSQKGKKKC